MYKVFTKPNCGYCVKAKALLDKLNIPFEEYKLSTGMASGDGEVTIEQMFEMIGKQVRSMPQIMSDDKHIGGYHFQMVQRYLLTKQDQKKVLQIIKQKNLLIH